MATIREIRRKLQTIGNIQKTTQAMELVAASRLRKAQSKAEMARPYSNKLKSILGRLIISSDVVEHALIEERQVKKIAYVVIAADRGLCGAYNHAVFSFTEKQLKKRDAASVVVLPFGRKTIEYFKRRPWKVEEAKGDWGGKITFAEIEAYSKMLIRQYLSGKYDEVWLIYTHYINITSREVRVQKLLNIDAEQQERSGYVESYIFEPNVQDLLGEILPHFVISQVQTALYEAYASELGARIFSMRAATKNAEELKEKLTLVRNKLRQSSITKELIEITSGAESTK